jgi:hypothetical protein
VRNATPTRSQSGILALAIAVGCAASGLEGRIYRDSEARYRIGELGEGWRRVRVGDRNDLAWYSESLSAIVQLNATCDPDADVPLVALTNHLLIGFTEREIRDQRTVPMDGREALRTHVVARLDGVPRELLLYVLKKNDCVYDFALIGRPGGSFERAIEVFERFVGGFTTDVR